MFQVVQNVDPELNSKSATSLLAQNTVIPSKTGWILDEFCG